MKTKLKNTGKLFLPPGSRRFRFARRIAQIFKIVEPIPVDVNYKEWIERTEPYTWVKYKNLDYEPKVSIVVPVFNPPAKYFMPMIYSVVNQTYQNWELILVNASSSMDCRRQTEKCTLIDTRIKTVNISRNEGIAGNTNAGIKVAIGKYVALLDHDDLLAPEALFEMINSVQDNQDAGLIYSDEDKINASGTDRFDPHFKPDWSPQLLRHANYINHFSLIRRQVLNKIEGYRSGFDGAQDYDLYLRIIDENPNIVHVPKVLYHWRTTETSTANDFSIKDNIRLAGESVLADHLKRNNINAKVIPDYKQPGYYHIKYEMDDNFKVAVLILPLSSKHQGALLTQYIHKTDPAIQIITYGEKDKADQNDEIIYLNEKDYSKFISESLNKTDANLFVVLGAGVIPIKENTITNLASQLSQDKLVGAIAPMILENDKCTIRDTGLIKVDNQYLEIFKGYSKNAHTYFGNSNWMRNLDSLTGRCLVVRRNIVENLSDCYTKNLFNPRQFEKIMLEENLQVCLNGSVEFKYVGDSKLSATSTKYFTPNFIEYKVEYGLQKLPNIPPEVDYNE